MSVKSPVKPIIKRAKASSPAESIEPTMLRGVNYLLDRADVLQLSGSRLYAHTVAYLTLAGAFEGKEMPQFDAALCRISNATRSYHKSKGNIEYGPRGGIRLTEQGLHHFAARPRNDLGLIHAYIFVMHRGEKPEGLGLQAAPIRV